MASSAAQPSPSTRAAASQIPSQSKLSSSLLFEIWPSARAPRGLTAKKKPFRRSPKVSRTTIT
jgi:hypothetical protein